ncbi:MAG: tetratricopeptide repeat protein [Armatimonadota bacterium]|nr:tetratricopeptide repeat protein [Armatimonadota bacterium]
MIEIVGTPDFASPGLDAGYHDYWARALVSGDWTPPKGFQDPQINSTPFFRPPGYPYFLALVYLITKSSHLWACIFQMFIGLINCFLAFYLGKRWFNSNVGLLFSALMAIYWVFVYFEGELLEPVLLVSLALCLMIILSLWTEKITWKRSIAGGILLGIYALTRPNILVFVPVVIAWVVWLAHRRNWQLPLGIAIVGFLIGALVTILPATIRNFIVAKEPVLICSNGGINLFLGNNPAADGYTPASPSIRRWSCYDYPAIVCLLERKLNRRLGYSEASKFFAKEALNYIKSHPLDVLKLTGKKALLFWGPKEVGNEKEDELERANSKILRILPGNFSIIFSFALVGLLMLKRSPKSVKTPNLDYRNEVTILILFFILSYFISYLPFFVAGRYRVPIVPFLLLFASIGIDNALRMATTHAWRSLAKWLLIWVAVFCLTSQNFARYEPNVAKWHFDRGVRYERTGHLMEAIREYHSAIQARPNYADAHYNLGVAFARQGRIADALNEFEETVRIRPTYAAAHFNKGVALAKMGKYEEALKALEEASRLVPDDYMAYYVLGSVHANLGQVDKAIKSLRKSLALMPDYAEAHLNLAQLLYGKGQYLEAWKEVELARKCGAEPSVSFLNALSEKLRRHDK